MTIINADFSEVKQLAGVFKGRLIRDVAGQPADIYIYWQNPTIKEIQELPLLKPGVYLSEAESIGIRLPALFRQKLQSEGNVAFDFIIETGRLEMQMLAIDDYYLLTFYRISTDMLPKKPQTTTLHNAFFEYADVGIIFMDPNALIQEVNPALENMTGYRANELVNIVTAGALRVPEIHQRLLNELLPFLENKNLTGKDIIPGYLQEKGILKRENTLLRKDGTQLPVLSTVTKIYDPLGQSLGYVNFIIDISALKQTQTQLSLANQRLKLATQVGEVGIWEFNILTGNYIWDEEAYKIHGVSSETKISLDFYLSLVHPEDKSCLMVNYPETDIPDFNLKPVRILSPDGKLRYIKSIGQRVNDEQRELTTVLGVVMDVTESYSAQMALSESEQRFRDIAENVDEIFWSRAAKGETFLYINPAYERITGKSCQSLYDDPNSFFDVVAEEDRSSLLALFSHEISDNYTIHFRIKVRDGTLRWFSARVFVIRDSEGKVVRRVGVAGDISLQKEKELILTQLLDKEKELNLFKTQFISQISHEFRTPLAVVQFSIELLHHYLFKTDDNGLEQKYIPKIRHHFSLIENKVKFFAELLTDMLTLQQIEIGKLSFIPNPTDAVLFLRDVLNNYFNDRTDGRKVEMRIEGLPRRICMDEKLMTRVLINLLSNAFKFSTTNPALHLSFEATEVKMEIIDQGIGIPAEDISRLFSTFFRAGNVGQISGTGLGLQIAKQLIEMHGGHIYVNSRQNEGTTMTIVLPL